MTAVTTDVDRLVAMRVRATATKIRQHNLVWEPLARVDPAVPISKLFGRRARKQGVQASVAIPLSIPATDVLARVAGDVPLRLLIPIAAAAALVWSRYARREDLLIAVAPLKGSEQAVLPIWLPSRPGEKCGELVARMAVAMQDAFAAAIAMPADSANLMDTGDGCMMVGYVPGRQEAPKDSELSVSVSLGSSRYFLRLEYDSARVGAALADQVARHVAHTCEQLLEHPIMAVDKVTLLGEDSQRVLLDLCRRSQARPGEHMLLHQRIREFAQSQPNRSALVSPGRTLTYAQLHQGGLAVADQLATAGIRRGDRVALLLDRGDLPVIAVLGTFLLGAVYVPLDPAEPDDRLRFMLADSGACAVVTEQERLGRVPVEFAGRMLVLASPDDLVARQAPELPGPPAHCEAYAIYTSGTTGRPKAALITHGAFAATCAAYQASYTLGAKEVCLQLGSFVFDVFNGDLGRSLYAGGTLVVCPDELRTDVEAVAELMAVHRVTIMESTPALIKPLIEALSRNPASQHSLRVLISSADAWRTEDYQAARKLLGKNVEIFNTYGVTEAAVDSTVFRAQDQNSGMGLAYMPVGKPMSGVTVGVVDQDLRLMPQGFPGELCIGGEGVGVGYLGRPSLTAERFVPDPFGTGGRIYRTGDLMRLMPSGDLEFLGRIDQQLKIRGFRIELGEVETVVRFHPSVREAAVVARDDGNGSARLVAYVACHGHPPSVTELRELCSKFLPRYMIPSLFVTIDALPLSRNGKVDRAALPDPGTDRQNLDVPFAEPCSASERLVTNVWTDVLGLDQVGVHDNFFTIGGHSLLAMRVMARLADVARVQLGVRAIFNEPTVAGLARLIDKAGGQPSPRSSAPALRRFDRSAYESD